MKTDNHDEGGEYDSTINDPLYQIQAKQAELYRYGGHGLKKDPSTAGKSQRYLHNTNNFSILADCVSVCPF